MSEPFLNPKATVLTATAAFMIIGASVTESSCEGDIYYYSEPIPSATSENTQQPDAEKEEFKRLVTQWQDDTEDLSILALRFSHRSYMRIIGKGMTAVPWILEELKYNPDWWFDALTAITGEDPAAHTENFDAAMNAWLEWGKSHCYNV